MNLIIDIGNTFTKLAICNNGIIETSHSFDNHNIVEILMCLDSLTFEKCIFTSVICHDAALEKYLAERIEKFILLDEKTPLPIENLYKDKKSLGKDRLAGVVGAGFLFPDTRVLVIDAGTAITFDLINEKNQYEGGTISPGLTMRFKALNHFTQKLPMVVPSENATLMATTTHGAILSGVINGMIYEIEGYISSIFSEATSGKTIITGGDAFFFDNKLKSSIFAEPDLIFLGLNCILEYNVHQI